MKKIIKLAVAVLFTFNFGLSTIQAQSPKKVAVKSITKEKVIMAPTAKPVTAVKTDVKTQLLREWKFHEFTLRAIKDGYLPSIAAQETAIIKLMIANYTFNKDGSIILDEKYIEKQGIKEAKWKLSDDGKLVITYFWTPEKQKKAGFTNNYERVRYKIDLISDKELTINVSDMFIVNLIIKTKKK